MRDKNGATDEIIHIAALAMKVPDEVAKKNYRLISDSGIFHFWNSARGGISVIINEAGEKLSSDTSVNFYTLFQLFMDGKRN